MPGEFGRVNPRVTTLQQSTVFRNDASREIMATNKAVSDATDTVITALTNVSKYDSQAMKKEKKQQKKYQENLFKSQLDNNIMSYQQKYVKQYEENGLINFEQIDKDTKDALYYIDQQSFLNSGEKEVYKQNYKNSIETVKNNIEMRGLKDSKSKIESETLSQIDNFERNVLGNLKAGEMYLPPSTLNNLNNMLGQLNMIDPIKYNEQSIKKMKLDFTKSVINVSTQKDLTEIYYDVSNKKLTEDQYKTIKNDMMNKYFSDTGELTSFLKQSGYFEESDIVELKNGVLNNLNQWENKVASYNKNENKLSDKKKIEAIGNITNGFLSTGQDEVITKGTGTAVNNVEAVKKSLQNYNLYQRDPTKVDANFVMNSENMSDKQILDTFENLYKNKSLKLYSKEDIGRYVASKNKQNDSVALENDIAIESRYDAFTYAEDGQLNENNYLTDIARLELVNEGILPSQNMLHLQQLSEDNNHEATSYIGTRNQLLNSQFKDKKNRFINPDEEKFATLGLQDNTFSKDVQGKYNSLLVMANDSLLPKKERMKYSGLATDITDSLSIMLNEYIYTSNNGNETKIDEDLKKIKKDGFTSFINKNDDLKQRMTSFIDESIKMQNLVDDKKSINFNGNPVRINKTTAGRETQEPNKANIVAQILSSNAVAYDYEKNTIIPLKGDNAKENYLMNNVKMINTDDEETLQVFMQNDTGDKRFPIYNYITDKNGNFVTSSPIFYNYRLNKIVK